MNKKVYTAPCITLTLFCSGDVITASEVHQPEVLFYSGYTVGNAQRNVDEDCFDAD